MWTVINYFLVLWTVITLLSQQSQSRATDHHAAPSNVTQFYRISCDITVSDAFHVYLRVHFRQFEYISRGASVFHAARVYFTRCKCISRGASVFHAVQVYFTRRECISRGVSVFHAVQVYFTRRECISRNVFIGNAVLTFLMQFYSQVILFPAPIQQLKSI